MTRRCGSCSSSGRTSTSSSRGAIWEDAKFGVRLAIPHLSAWERTAVVSDVPWIHRAIATFGWMQPGELRVFPLDEAEEAKAWLGR